MAATGERAAELLDAHAAPRASRSRSAMRPLDFLTGLPSQSTFIEPGRRLYELLEQLEREHDTVLSFTPGFPMADFPECQMAVFGYGPDAGARAARGRRARAGAIARRRARVRAGAATTPRRRAWRAPRSAASPGAPVVLADTQDNPGAGGNGDTTGLLAALLERDPRDAVLGLLIDRASAKQAHEVGVGRTARVQARRDLRRAGPRAARRRVRGRGARRRQVHLHRARCSRASGWSSGRWRCCASGNVRVVLASKKVQAADQEMFRHVGIEPVQQRILALKSSVHFRADFQPIAREVLVVVAPGPAKADPTMFHWTRLRPGCG